MDAGKTALLLEDGQWMQPIGATPTTHILKLPLGGPPAYQYDLTDPVENEWVCLQLLAPDAFEAMTTLSNAVEGALEQVAGKLPDGFTPGIWSSLSTGMAQQAERFRRGLQAA